MKTPLKLTGSEIATAVLAFLYQDCNQSDQGWRHKPCGTPIESQEVTFAVHRAGPWCVPRLALQNGALVPEVRLMVPYCPRCETSPEQSSCVHLEPLLQSLKGGPPHEFADA